MKKMTAIVGLLAVVALAACEKTVVNPPAETTIVNPTVEKEVAVPVVVPAPTPAPAAGSTDQGPTGSTTMQEQNGTPGTPVPAQR